MLTPTCTFTNNSKYKYKLQIKHLCKKLCHLVNDLLIFFGRIVKQKYAYIEKGLCFLLFARKFVNRK